MNAALLEMRFFGLELHATLRLVSYSPKHACYMYFKYMYNSKTMATCGKQFKSGKAKK